MNKKNVILLALLILGFSMLTTTISAAETTISSNTMGGIKEKLNYDTIYLNPGTYSGENNTNLTISKNIKIIGNGSRDKIILDGKGNRTIFRISKNINVTLINITFRNGYSSSLYTSVNGLSGGISNSGNLSISNCIFMNNRAMSSGGGSGFGYYYGGGAIINHETGNLNINSSLFESNSAFSGGAISNRGNLRIENTNFTNNNATPTNPLNPSFDYGGAIYSSVGRLYINNSYFAENYGWGGGAIFLYDSNCTITNSRFNNNYAVYNYKHDLSNNAHGGAIYNYKYHSGAILTIENSIFSYNRAYTASTPKAHSIYSNVDFTLKNSTFTGYDPFYFPNTTINQIIQINDEDDNNNSSKENPPVKNQTNTKINSQIFLSDLKGSYGQIITLTTKLISNNKILTGKTVYFYVNNKLIGSAKTNNQGMASLKYKIPSVAKYIVKTVFNGDTSYNKIETTKQFISTKAKTTMTLNKKLYKKKIYVKVTALGKPLKSKLIKFYIKGKYVGKAKTNSKGIALFKPKKKFKGKQIIKAIFNGDKLFSKVNKSAKIKL